MRLMAHTVHAISPHTAQASRWGVHGRCAGAPVVAGAELPLAGCVYQAGLITVRAAGSCGPSVVHEVSCWMAFRVTASHQFSHCWGSRVAGRR